MGSSDKEFPVLGGLGLYAGETTGRGDCLFMALSDQLYGDESRHQEIRARVVQHMRDHAAAYKPFTTVNLGGGTRRNLRRKGASYSTAFESRDPTDDEVELQYQNNLAEMAKPGTYADHLQIQAFSAEYGIMVRVYREEGVLEDITPDALGTGPASSGDVVAKLAYHTHEHYSTIRQIEYTHIGILNVTTETADDLASASDSSTGGVRLHLAPPKPISKYLSLPHGDRRKHHSRERKRLRRALEALQV